MQCVDIKKNYSLTFNKMGYNSFDHIGKPHGAHITS